jgi:hypothetical protein
MSAGGEDRFRSRQGEKGAGDFSRKNTLKNDLIPIKGFSS